MTTITKKKTRIASLVLFSALSLIVTASAHADEKCGPGRVYDRGVIGCIQAVCPPTTGRNYGGVCQCYNSDWGGNQKKRTDCYDKNGLLSHCAPEGMSCEKVTPWFDPMTGAVDEAETFRAEEDAGIVNPAHHVMIEKRIPECESRDGGPITVRTTIVPPGFIIENSVAANEGGRLIIAGQDAEAEYGDKIRVPSGHEATVTIGGVAIVHLSENSVFTIPCSADRARLEGRGFFEILHDALTGQNQFQVEYANGIAGSRGTRYLVDANTPTSTQVMLLDGSVEVTSKATGEKKLLSPGEKATISDSLPSITISPMTAAEKESLSRYEKSSGRSMLSYTVIGFVLIVSLVIVARIYLKKRRAYVN